MTARVEIRENYGRHPLPEGALHIKSHDGRIPLLFQRALQKFLK